MLKRLLRNNGLTIALVGPTLFSLVGMALTGLNLENGTLAEHGQQPLGMMSYLVSGSFLSAVFANWESEFLQMSAYVMLTALLFQVGSSESKEFLLAWHCSRSAVSGVLCAPFR